MSQRVEASSIVNIRREVVQSQEAVREAIEALDVQILGSTQSVINALLVRCTPEQSQAIQEMSQVKRVVASTQYSTMLDTIPEIVRLPARLSEVPGSGNSGEGMKIAIIDTGLDFNHVAFQDESLPLIEGYPKGLPEDLHFASRKVIVVRSYVDLLNSHVPTSSTPDDLSPQDYLGHGTAVAMVAAGRRVETPVGSIEGVAPRAYLGVYKIGGTPGINDGSSSNAVIAAIDGAVMDGMDILNISLGSPSRFPWNASGSDCELSSSLGDCDPVSIAAQSAVVDFGLVVVCAAGNEGDSGINPPPLKNSINSPANAPDVITVGATEHLRQFTQSVRVGTNVFNAQTGTGPEPDQVLSAPVIFSDQFENLLGCNPYPPGSLNGRILVVERGICLFLEKVQYAAAAGAVGVVVVNNEGSDLLIVMGGLSSTRIPAFLIGATAGMTLRNQSTPNRSMVALDPSPVRHLLDSLKVAYLSSRGPTVDLNLKPDIVAPGTYVYSASLSSEQEDSNLISTDFEHYAGTSFATPIVAGAAALVWGKHPHLTAHEVASALVNTASQTVVEDEETARVVSVGGGLLDVERALAPIATVVPPTVGFGVLDRSGLPVSKEITITNHGVSPQSYRMNIEQRDTSPFAQVTIDGSTQTTFVLDPSQNIKLRIALEGRIPLPGSYEGHLRLIRMGDGASLLVPYLYVLGDQVPHNAAQLLGSNIAGIVGESEQVFLSAKIVDQYGVPVEQFPFQFLVEKGVGSVQRFLPETDTNGLIRAVIQYAATPGEQLVSAYGGNLRIPFRYENVGARPIIQAIVNAANPTVYPGVSAGSMITIYGRNFSQFVEQVDANPLPIAIRRSSVSFDYPQLGLSIPGRLLAINKYSVTVQVPWELSGLNYCYVKVRTSYRDSNKFVSIPYVVSLNQVTPGIYTTMPFGHQQSARIYHPDNTLVSPAYPARSGGSVVIHMTGNGPVESPPKTGEVSKSLNPTLHQPTVLFAGRRATVTYSGLVPGTVGRYQVDVIVPNYLPHGDVTLQVSILGVNSNQVIIPVH